MFFNNKCSTTSFLLVTENCDILQCTPTCVYTYIHILCCYDNNRFYIFVYTPSSKVHIAFYMYIKLVYMSAIHLLMFGSLFPRARALYYGLHSTQYTCSEHTITYTMRRTGFDCEYLQIASFSTIRNHLITQS